MSKDKNKIWREKVLYWLNKAWVYLHQQRFLLLCVLVIWIQHRYWIYKDIYENFSTHLGGQGTVHYNLALIAQRAIHIWNGRWFSLEGDHFYWFMDNLGVASHHLVSGILFVFLYPFSENTVLTFNLIQFGNIFLLQVGIYLLVKKYTRNWAISIFVALLVPLSQAYWTVYGDHIHASLYWTLPYLVLLLDRLLEKKDLTKWKLFLVLFGIFITGGWLALADWHVAIFAMIWLVPWGLYKLTQVLSNFQYLKYRVLGLIFTACLVAIIAAPFAVGALNASKTYGQVRSLTDITSTNFEIDRFFGSKQVIETALNVSAPFLKQTDRFAKTDFGEKVREVRKGASNYPDGISNITFWLGCLLFIPWLLVLIYKKGEFYAREFVLLSIFLLGSFIAIGPFIKVFGMTWQQFPLPHYYIYQVFFPLSAIRATWRSMSVAYLAVLVLWSLILSHIWKVFQKTDLYIDLTNSANDNWSKYWQKSLKFIFTLILLVGTIGFLFIQNNGATGRAYLAFQEDKFLTNQWLRESVDGQGPLEFFVWSDGAGMHTERNRYYNYLLTKHNLDQGEMDAVWVIGGSFGATTNQVQNLIAYVLAQSNSDMVATVLASKKTDIIIEEKDFSRSPEYTREVESALSKFYNLVDENDEYRSWRWREAPEDFIDNPNDLVFDIATSNYQRQGGDWFILVNIANESDKVYANLEQARPIDYTLEFWQNGKLKDKDEFRLGSTPFFFAGDGRSLQTVVNPNLGIGDVEIKLYREDNQVAVKTVTNLSSNEYDKKIESLESEPVTLDQSDKSVVEKYRFLENIGPYRGALHTTDLKLKFDLDSGVVQNDPKRLPIDKNNKVVALFWNDSGEVYRSFPGWLWQPQCELNGNYFAGDELTVWCESHLPFDSNYHFVAPQLNEDR